MLAHQIIAAVNAPIGTAIF